MGKSRVILKPQKIADGDWQIRAFLPDAEIGYISGFKSDSEAYDWISSGKSAEWLKSHGVKDV